MELSVGDLPLIYGSTCMDLWFSKPVLPFYWSQCGGFGPLKTVEKIRNPVLAPELVTILGNSDISKLGGYAAPL
jgi:hypothetical protein